MTAMLCDGVKPVRSVLCSVHRAGARIREGME